MIYLKNKDRLKNKTMIKTNLTLLLFFLFSGFLNAQVNDSKKCDCDSILKSKIGSLITFSINGRVPKKLITPNDVTCEIGKFYFDIIVNREGDIIQADLNKKFSSEISNKLKNALIEAIMKSKFTKKNDAPAKLKGIITYTFLLKDKY